MRNPSDTKLLRAVSLKQLEQAMDTKPAPNVNAQDTYGRTALYNAVRCGRYDQAVYLLECGADVTISPKCNDSEDSDSEDSDYDHTPPLLEAAIFSGKVKMLKLIGSKLGLSEEEISSHLQSVSNARLLRASEFAYNRFDKVRDAMRAEPAPNVNAQDSRGQTALYIAVRRGSYEVVKYLLEQNANVNIAPQGAKRSILEWANRYGNKSLISLIEEALAKYETNQQCDESGESESKQEYGSAAAQEAGVVDQLNPVAQAGVSAPGAGAGSASAAGAGVSMPRVPAAAAAQQAVAVDDLNPAAETAVEISDITLENLDEILTREGVSREKRVKIFAATKLYCSYQFHIAPDDRARKCWGFKFTDVSRAFDAQKTTPEFKAEVDKKEIEYHRHYRSYYIGSYRPIDYKQSALSLQGSISQLTNEYPLTSQVLSQVLSVRAHSPAARAMDSGTGFASAAGAGVSARGAGAGSAAAASSARALNGAQGSTLLGRRRTASSVGTACDPDENGKARAGDASPTSS